MTERVGEVRGQSLGDVLLASSSPAHACTALPRAPVHGQPQTSTSSRRGRRILYSLNLSHAVGRPTGSLFIRSQRPRFDLLSLW